MPCGGAYWLQHPEYAQLHGQPAENPCATLPCVHLGHHSKTSHGDYRLVMGTACGWLLWTVILWSVAYRKFKRGSSVGGASVASVGNVQDDSRESLLASGH